MAFALIGFVGTKEKGLFEIQNSNWIATGTILALSAGIAHFFFQNIQNQMKSFSNLKDVQGEALEKKLTQIGIALAKYAALLMVIELPALVGFVTGFLGGSYPFMLPFILSSLILQFFSLPKRLF